MPRGRAFLTALASLVLAACSAPAPDGSPAPAASPASTAGATEPGDSGSNAASPAASPSSAPISGGPPAIALEEVASELADPINITGSPEGWLLVNERGGTVVAVHPSDGRTSLVLDITDRVLGAGEQGLLGLALHPDWPDVPRAFVHYSARSNRDGVLSELTGTPGSADTPPTLDAGSEQVLLRVPDSYPNHNGGQLAFGPDGFLYMGLGDGGGAGDPDGNGQNTSTLLGSILRLDVSTPGVRGVPVDNPFADGADGAPEVFLYGLRNPWRFSFDIPTGQLWIADVGQNAYEEINRIDPVTQAGANLGWNLMESAHCFDAADCASDGLVLPLSEYGREMGGSITGGFVYRGDAIPALKGWYLFGDYLSGRIFGVASDAQPSADGTPVAPSSLLESGLLISAFGEGADRELYVADLSAGTIYRIVAP